MSCSVRSCTPGREQLGADPLPGGGEFLGGAAFGSDRDLDLGSRRKRHARDEDSALLFDGGRGFVNAHGSDPAGTEAQLILLFHLRTWEAIALTRR